MKGLNLYNSVVNSLWFNQIAEADKNSSYPTLLQLFESSDLEKKTILMMENSQKIKFVPMVVA